MKEFKLEYTKKEQDGSVFYQYSYDDCRFWFSQKPNGNIYGVTVENNMHPQVDFYVEDGEYDFYPQIVRMNIPRVQITSETGMEKFNRMVQDVCKLRQALQNFFETSEHAKLYRENHKEKSNVQ